MLIQLWCSGLCSEVCCLTPSTETVSLLGTGAQDGHLDFHTAPELCFVLFQIVVYLQSAISPPPPPLRPPTPPTRKKERHPQGALHIHSSFITTLCQFVSHGCHREKTKTNKNMKNNFIQEYLDPVKYSFCSFSKQTFLQRNNYQQL